MHNSFIRGQNCSDTSLDAWSCDIGTSVYSISIKVIVLFIENLPVLQSASCERV